MPDQKSIDDLLVSMDGIVSFVHGLAGFLFRRHRRQRKLPLSHGRQTRALSMEESGHGRPSKEPLPVGGHNDRDKDECSCMRRPRTIAPSADSCNMAGLKRRRIELQEGRSYLPVDSGASVTSRRSDRHKLVDDTLQIDDDRSPSSAGKIVF
ncbi:hypothetical protein OPV22_029668 [Ensete ventricosum]|uniref:DUF4005 domain-containing protein n=1 Tax=Ensete ventricosum TaxID=4639 RepID=A0AAV8P6B7_ENSVE|nr:hypothetical protein OPV22_029668 [Ensete ventricosum]